MLHRPSLILSISFVELALRTFVYRNGGLSTLGGMAPSMEQTICQTWKRN